MEVKYWSTLEQLERSQSNALRLICGPVETIPMPAMQLYTQNQPIEGLSLIHI